MINQTFSGLSLRRFGGLTERLLVVEVFAWSVALGWIALRSKQPLDAEGFTFPTGRLRVQL